MEHPISLTPDVAAVGGDSTLGPVTPSPFTAEVYIYVGGAQIAKYSIEQGEYLIGRDASCPIAIDADRVSRHHARLTFSSYELSIEDLESSNGLFIDGVQVQLPTRLYPDQEVQIGSARLFVRLNDATARQLSESLWDADLGLAPVRDLLEGKRYKALTTVARGGMGVILQARDLRIRRNVAMKVMKTGAHFSRESVLRFIDEAQLTGQLEHPNIVPVYELGIDDHGETFYTMKFVKGTTLDEILRGIRHGRQEIIDKYPLASLVTIFQKICDAVAFAHAKGVIHRDLKPENVMIGSYGEVLVMDWGLAKQTTGAQRPESRIETALDSKPRDPLRGFETLHGVVVGTPPYVSPEQARGELDLVDTKSDIYVLGAILYAILTLRATVQGESVETVLNKIIAGDIQPPLQFNRRPKKWRKMKAGQTKARIALTHCPQQRIPDGLAAIAMNALRLDPADRYQTVEELQADITAYQGGFAPKAEGAGLLRHMFLFAVRHRREFSLLASFALIIQLLLVGFIVQLNREKNLALVEKANAEKVAGDLANLDKKLRGTAPTFEEDAKSLVEHGNLEKALEKIDDAIEEVPNEPRYHALRGNILETLTRFSYAAASYSKALELHGKTPKLKENLELTQKLMAQVGDDAQIPKQVLRDLRKELLSQNRTSEAAFVDAQLGGERKHGTWSAELEKLGFKAEQKGDESFYVVYNNNNRKRLLPDLRMLRNGPVTGLNLDDSRFSDIGALKGMHLTSLSLGGSSVKDLGPLVGMPLHTLTIDNTDVTNLTPLSHLPLETLRMAGTSVKDISALNGVPLQKLDMSRTEVTDLTPLKDSPIRELSLDGCVDLVDLHPLMEMKNLESVVIPANSKDFLFLREHPSIKRLSFHRLTQPAAEFWQEWDAKQEAKRGAR